MRPLQDSGNYELNLATCHAVIHEGGSTPSNAKEKKESSGFFPNNASFGRSIRLRRNRIAPRSGLFKGLNNFPVGTKFHHVAGGIKQSVV